MAETLSTNAFIDYAYYNSLSGESFTSTDQQLIILINTITEIFETTANRLLKARDFSYDLDSVSYNADYSIFDPPENENFYFPTFPVNSITEIKISDVIITAATDYYADDGYVLYNRAGKLYYYNGFDYGYFKNIKIKWNGGYASGSPLYSALQYWTYLSVNKMLNNTVNSEMLSESIGNYRYTKNPEYLSQFKGLLPEVYKYLIRLSKRGFA